MALSVDRRFLFFLGPLVPTNTKQALAHELRQSMLLGYAALEPVGLGNRRLQTDLSGPFLASPLFENTVFFAP